MGSQNSTETPRQAAEAAEENRQASQIDEDEPDEWDKRIYSTGCADCYFEKKDWRACAKEMEDFKACWKSHGNEQRTMSKDA